ncbi:TPA: hypothetical protein IF258_004999 [Escherichia coli]|nr:hypothetical protein [Escherichia coli]
MDGWTKWVPVTTTGPREFRLMLSASSGVINPGFGDAECTFRIESTKWGLGNIYKLKVHADPVRAAVTVSPTHVSALTDSRGAWSTDEITLTWEEFGMSQIVVSSRDDMSVEFTSGRPSLTSKYELGPANSLTVLGLHQINAADIGYYSRKKWVTMRFSGTTRQPKTYIVNFTHEFS